jgi:hypothetical protein
MREVNLHHGNDLTLVLRAVDLPKEGFHDEWLFDS